MTEGLEMKPRSRMFRVAVPVLIVAVGIAVMIALVKMKPKAARKPVEHHSTLVSVVEVAPSSSRVKVRGMGTVIPARSVTILPEVSGRLVEVSPDLVPGGHLRKGDILARIDDSDYRTAVAQQKANLARARFEMKVESGRGAVARKEWDQLGREVTTSSDGRDLALREPHKENAKAAVTAAESALSMAQRNLERTRIRAPFNAFVQSENVDVGQVVGPQSPVATLVGIDRFWVQVAITVDDLGWIDVPGLVAEAGSTARVINETGTGDPTAREGRVVRLLGDLDPVGRMARVLVEVDNPMATGEGQPELPLLLGSYVRVEILGRPLEGVWTIPREALRDGDRIFVMDAAGTLDIRDVKVVRRTDGMVAMRDGLKKGDRLVVSRIDTPVQGMALRLGNEPDATPRAGSVTEGEVAQ